LIAGIVDGINVIIPPAIVAVPSDGEALIVTPVNVSLTIVKYEEVFIVNV